MIKKTVIFGVVAAVSYYIGSRREYFAECVKAGWHNGQEGRILPKEGQIAEIYSRTMK